MRRWIFVAWLIACVVVPLGAYVRLSDAGLGCPDWPGCYGQPSPLHAADAIAQAEAQQPGGPVSAPKAWKEMVHRYLAASLGLLIVVLNVMAWRRRRYRWQAGVLLALVLGQGLLGMWTVTLLLKPAIVSSHLLGGMTLAAALAAWAWSSRSAPVAVARPLLVLGHALPLAVLAQIALGGWTSSNYAALACQGLPTCNGAWWPADMRFEHAFHLTRELGQTPDGGLLGLPQLVAIHWTHRLGALLLSLLLWGVVWQGWRHVALRPRLLGLLTAWGLQLALGMANVWWQLPLPVAVAHNAGALLLLSLSLLFCLSLRPEAARGPAILTRGVLEGRGE